MSKLALVIVMMLMAVRINAQNYPAPNKEIPTDYFVLIQSDNGQPFYVRVKNQIYSSSSAGYLILSQLKDSVYTITVGFPGQPAAEHYLTRQGETWGLFDKQEQALPSVVDTAAIGRPPLAGVKKDDPFSQLMSAIVQDTAVMYNTYVAASPDTSQSPNLSPGAPQSASPSPDTSAATLVSSGDTIPSALGATIPSAPGSTIPSAPRSTIPTASGVVPSSPTGVVKLSERRSTKSLTLVYTDHPDDKRTDTIDVLIPVESGPLPPRKLKADAAHSTNPVVSQKPKPDTTYPANAVAGRDPQPDSIHSIVRSAADGQDSKPDTATAAATTPGKPTLPFVNSDCHAFATDNDVDKLRVHMLAVGKYDDRIQTAYKTFKIKCFTTRQIRALSDLFSTDAAKFKFLATAYPFVSDEKFADLASLLSDPVYVDKFRTMTTPH
jgi:hypothetical protein